MSELNLDKVFRRTSSPRSRRSGAELLRDMLMAAEGGAKKTHVMFKSNVNPLVLEKYLSFCVQNGLIAKDKLGYTTTAKGLKLIKCLNQISDLRKNLGEVESEVDKLIRNPPWEDQQ